MSISIFGREIASPASHSQFINTLSRGKLAERSASLFQHNIFILKAHNKTCAHWLAHALLLCGGNRLEHQPPLVDIPYLLLDSSQPSLPHNALPVSFLVYFTIKLAVSHTYFNLAPTPKASAARRGHEP